MTLENKIVAETRVEKMLGPEEISMLSNINSMIQEVIQMGGQGSLIDGGAGPIQASMGIRKEENNIATTGDMEDKAFKEKVEIDEEDKEVDKMLVTSPSDSNATASDDAKDRIDDTLTELTEEGVDEVAKAVQLIMKAIKNGGVAKSEPINPLIGVIANMVEVQKSTQTQINEISLGFNNLIEGLGITEQMNVTQSRESSAAVKKAEPIVSADNEATMDFMRTIVAAVEGANVKKAEFPEPAQSNIYMNNTEIVRKNLSDPDTLASLIANKEVKSGNYKLRG